MIKNVRLVRCSFIEFSSMNGSSALIRLKYPGEDRLVKVHCGTSVNRRHMTRQIQWALLSDQPSKYARMGKITPLKWMTKKRPGKWPFTNRVIIGLELSKQDFDLDWSRLRPKFLSSSPSFAKLGVCAAYDEYRDWMWLPDSVFGVRGCLIEEGLICHSRAEATLAFLAYSDASDYEYE